MGFVFLAALVFVIALIARFAGARVPDVVLIVLGVITVVGAISLFWGAPDRVVTSRGARTRRTSGRRGS